MTFYLNAAERWISRLFLKLNPDKTEIIYLVVTLFLNGLNLWGNKPNGHYIHFTVSKKNFSLLTDQNFELCNFCYAIYNLLHDVNSKRE